MLKCSNKASFGADCLWSSKSFLAKSLVKRVGLELLPRVEELETPVEEGDAGLVSFGESEVNEEATKKASKTKECMNC